MYKAEEILASRLATYHNLYFYRKLMEGIRRAIEQNRFKEFRREFLAKYHKHRAEVHDEEARAEG
jgi:queuine tRNA-ribosyltransferase